MTLDRLRNALEALGPPVTPLELAEMLWLAERIPGGGTPSEAPDGPNSGDVGTGMLLGPAQGAPCATRAGTPRVEEPTPETEAAAPAPVDEARRPLHVSRRRAGVDAEEVLVPAAQVLRGELAIQRALRPLKRRVPDRRRLILNEDATAALAARHPGLRPWAPVMVPGSERFLSLALVVDAGPTMTIWDPLVSELHEAMQRTGAFRDLRVWHLTDNGMHLGIRSGPSSPVRNPAALLDPTGRQVVLVLSDCAGPHWWAGHTAPLLHRWARCSPTAILQPLPERLWRRTAAPATPGTAVLSHAAAPNTALRFMPHDGRPPRQPGHVPVPVLELAPEWLGDWARLLMASGGRRRDTAVVHVSAHPTPHEEPLTAEGHLPITERLLRFQSAASPGAVDLAAHVALSAPALPVMRLIQQHITMTSRPSDLAEVLLSGLLEPVSVAEGLYAFVPGARRALLETLPRTESLEAAEMLSRIGEGIKARAGATTRAFRALVPVADGVGDWGLGGSGEPFALVSTEALEVLRSTAVRVASAPAAEAPVGGSDVDVTVDSSASGVGDQIDRDMQAQLHPAGGPHMTDNVLGTGNRDALLIATGTYDDRALSTLNSPGQDCAALSDVLADPRIGGFGTEQVRDAPAHQVMRAVERFFLNRSPDDLLLLYVSCHGIKDEAGHLYFAARDTDRNLLASTAIPAAFLHDRMERCRARTMVVLLDCSFSGAFLPGAKQDGQIHVRDELGGRGRAVLTASGRTEYAWEGEGLRSKGPQLSLFTGAVIEGLRTGAADLNRDGRITVTELYDYVYESLQRAGVNQRPQMWANMEYHVTIARAMGVRERAGDAEVVPVQDPPVPPRPQAPPAGETTGTEGRTIRDRLGGLFGRARTEPPTTEPHEVPESGADAGLQTKESYPRSRTRRGHDALIRLELELKEASLGTTKDIELDTAAVCPTCSGVGTAKGTLPRQCNTCGGTGLATETRGFRGRLPATHPCEKCQGYGTRLPRPCSGCDGGGRVRVRRTLTVRIPAGVENGTRIQLAGEGEVGPGGGPAGDLYVEVVELPHQVFQRINDDLYCTLTIPRATATTGGTLPLETLDGRKTVRIPEGVRDGQTLRLANLGVAHLRGGGRGDLLVRVEIGD